MDVISRWLHVGTAIVLLGGTAFQWMVLRPSARQLPDAEHDRLRALVMGRWRWIVMMGIAVLLITGFYNYLFAATPADVWRLYHPLVGTKILLAFGVFFLASALTGRSAAFAELRRQPGRWLLLLLLLGAAVVAISSYLKVGGAQALRSASHANQSVD
jgi:uncharacterized membrane protein